jgi:hypothetical protein
MLGGAFEQMAGGFTNDLKYAHYAKLPPRAVFRGHILSCAVNCLNPAVALFGVLNWAGNNNLTYATLGIYIAWFFQFFLKRRYTAWWGKYAYLIFASLNVGVAISGLNVTLVFSFGAGKNVSFHWWGNDVAQRGVDWQLYNNNASLIPLPASGYFGLAPDQYPLEW